MTTQTLREDFAPLISDNNPYEPSSTAFSIQAGSLPLEGGTDPLFGTVR